MPQTSKEMLQEVDDRIANTRAESKQQKEVLENLENQLKVEERMFIELGEKKDELAENQKYIVMAVRDEIEFQKGKLDELETDLKLLYKKHEVLSRPTWNF